MFSLMESRRMKCIRTCVSSSGQEALRDSHAVVAWMCMRATRASVIHLYRGCSSDCYQQHLYLDVCQRPDPELIANALHLNLWAPDCWKHSLPSQLEIRRWMIQFAAETFLLSSPYNVQRHSDAKCSNISVVNALKVQFLSRANPSSVTAAAQLLWDVSGDGGWCQKISIVQTRLQTAIVVVQHKHFSFLLTLV